MATLTPPPSPPTQKLGAVSCLKTLRAPSCRRTLHAGWLDDPLVLMIACRHVCLCRNVCLCLRACVCAYLRACVPHNLPNHHTCRTRKLHTLENDRQRQRLRGLHKRRQPCWLFSCAWLAFLSLSLSLSASRLSVPFCVSCFLSFSLPPSLPSSLSFPPSVSISISISQPPNGKCFSHREQQHTTACPPPFLPAPLFSLQPHPRCWWRGCHPCPWLRSYTSCPRTHNVAQSPAAAAARAMPPPMPPKPDKPPGMLKGSQGRGEKEMKGEREKDRER